MTLNKVLYGEALPRIPNPYCFQAPAAVFYTIFGRKGPPFVYLLLTNGAP